MVLRGSYGILGFKLGLVSYKASTLPTLLSLWPQPCQLSMIAVKKLVPNTKIIIAKNISVSPCVCVCFFFRCRSCFQLLTFDIGYNSLKYQVILQVSLWRLIGVSILWRMCYCECVCMLYLCVVFIHSNHSIINRNLASKLLLALICVDKILN